MPVRIRLLGRPEIVDARGVRQPVRGLQPWALLARVLLSRREVGRRELAAGLFPESVDPLGSVRWCLAMLRRALGTAQALQGDPVQPNLPRGTRVDVLEIEDEDFDPFVAGDLLEGVEPRCGPEFATWLLVARERIGSRLDARIRRDTLQAMAAGRHDEATALAELGVRRLPLDERAHVLLVRCLVLGGSETAARAHVAATEAAFQEALGEKPSAARRGAAQPHTPARPAALSRRSVVDSHLQAGRAALAAGAGDAALQCLRRAAAEAEAGDEPLLHAEALFELGSALVHSVRGHDDEGAILLRQAVERAERAGAARIATEALRELGYVDALAGRRPAADGYLRRALSIAEHADTLAAVHSVMGFNLVDWGSPAQGLEHYRHSLEHARRGGNRRREAWALGIGAWGQLAAGDLEAAACWTRRCLDIVEDLRWVAFRPWPLAVLAETQLRAGSEPEKQREPLETAFALSCQVADPCWEAASARVLGLTWMASGDHDAALHWLQQARRRCLRETDAYAGLLVHVLADTADCLLAAGRDGEAEPVLRETVSLAARFHMDALLGSAVARLRRLRPDTRR